MSSFNLKTVLANNETVGARLARLNDLSVCNYDGDGLGVMIDGTNTVASVVTGIVSDKDEISRTLPGPDGFYINETFDHESNTAFSECGFIKREAAMKMLDALIAEGAPNVTGLFRKSYAVGEPGSNAAMTKLINSLNAVDGIVVVDCPHTAYRKVVIDKDAGRTIGFIDTDYVKPRGVVIHGGYATFLKYLFTL